MLVLQIFFIRTDNKLLEIRLQCHCIVLMVNLLFILEYIKTLNVQIDVMSSVSASFDTAWHANACLLIFPSLPNFLKHLKNIITLHIKLFCSYKLGYSLKNVRIMFTRSCQKFLNFTSCPKNLGAGLIFQPS